MSEPARNRFALDLDDLERQLRGAAEPQKPGSNADPLMELTRIVNQDDPLKGLFAARPTPVPAAPQPAPATWQPPLRQEPSFERAEPVYQAAPLPVAADAPPAEVRGALDEFEALLRRSETVRPPAAAEAEAFALPMPGEQAAELPRDLDEAHGHDYAQDHGGDQRADYPEPPLLADEEMRDLEPQRSRKGLWTAAALVAVGIIGVAGAMAYRGRAPASDGQPPVISADSSPTKVAPTNPGGTEIPNQNKQIYERGTDATADKSKVVNRDEQPIDVQQAARTLPARVVLPGPGSTNGAADATSGANALALAPAAPDRSAAPASNVPVLTPVPAVPGLGEPRKVRTVSIRPDGTPAGAPSATALVPGVNGTIATGSAPTRSASVAAPEAAAPAPVLTETVQPRPRPSTLDTPKAQERVATPAPATTPSSPTRIASAQPAAARPAPAVTALRGGTGDFAVQLAAPGSEAEARATFAALQRKYPDQLSGQSPIVRKTDLAGGKTVYRLRVGPYSREDATTMCTRLQSAGGQCFIAKN